jgi:hypothetical protein
VKYWDAVQARRAPTDPLLALTESRLFETLAIDPADPSGLNRSGSVLIERELAAAQFFVAAAIRAAKAQGMTSWRRATVYGPATLSATPPRR